MMTPKLDKKVKWSLGVMTLKQLFPITIPTMISATAVGTVVTCRRAMTMGITRASRTTKNSENPSIIKFVSLFQLHLL